MEEMEQCRCTKKIQCGADWSKAVTFDSKIKKKNCLFSCLTLFPLIIALRINDHSLHNLETCTLNWDNGRHIFSCVTFDAFTCLCLLCCSLCSSLSSLTAPREDPDGSFWEENLSCTRPVSPIKAAPYQSLSLQGQANTVDETRYLCSLAVGQAEAHVFMRSGKQAAS